MEIPTGAYVIRASQTSTVLQIKCTTLLGWSWTVVSGQDENNRRDQQIWWIEPLPKDDLEDGDEEMMYSITNTSSGKTLGLKCANGEKQQNGKGTWITACPAVGTLCQRWKIRRGQDSEGGIYYTLINVDNDHLLDIEISGSGDNAVKYGFAREYTSGRKEQLWELVVPKVAFPCGWLHIQNTETGALLAHQYLSSPPFLLKPQPSVLASSTQYREAWDTQWALVHAKSHDPEYKYAPGKTEWCIRNRLTKAFLSNTAYKLRDTTGPTVTGMESDLLPAGSKGFKRGLNIAEFTWELDLDLNRNWNIINNNTSCLLQAAQVASSSGKTRVVCVSKKVVGSNSWALVSPVSKILNEVCILGDIKFSEDSLLE